METNQSTTKTHNLEIVDDSVVIENMRTHLARTVTGWATRSHDEQESWITAALEMGVSVG